VLREGKNGFTCFPGHPTVIEDIAYCANADALQWEEDRHGHKPKPTNVQPGIEYMLAGGTYRSATDPYATSGMPFTEGPHWIILWPFDPGTTGLPEKLKQTGTWIMWAGNALLPPHDQPATISSLIFGNHVDTVEVWGSSPHGPTIVFNHLAKIVQKLHL